MSTTKKNSRKKAGDGDAPIDLRKPIQPTPAALAQMLDQVRELVPKLPVPAAPGPSDLVCVMMHFTFAERLPDGIGQEVVRRIETGFVDRNELRVTESYEVAEMLADLQIPDVFQCCERVREVVTQIYADQNGVNLDFLREAAVSDRNQFFQRVPGVTPALQRTLSSWMSFEECIFSDRSTLRVQQRLGFEPKGDEVQQFLAELKTLLAPFGHMPLNVGPHREDGRPLLEPVLSIGSQLLRLGPPLHK